MSYYPCAYRRAASASSIQRIDRHSTTQPLRTSRRTRSVRWLALRDTFGGHSPNCTRMLVLFPWRRCSHRQATNAWKRRGIIKLVVRVAGKWALLSIVCRTPIRGSGMGIENIRQKSRHFRHQSRGNFSDFFFIEKPVPSRCRRAYGILIGRNVSYYFILCVHRWRKK